MCTLQYRHSFAGVHVCVAMSRSGGRHDAQRGASGAWKELTVSSVEATSPASALYSLSRNAESDMV